MMGLRANGSAPSEEKAKGKRQKSKVKSEEQGFRGLGGRRRGSSLLTFAFCLLPFALALTACSAKPPPVKVEPTPNVSFASYRTYAWLPTAGGPDKDLFGERLQNEVEVQMAGKGYIITGDGPDLLLQTEVVVEERNAETIGDFVRYEEAGGTQNLYAAFAIGYERAVVSVNVYDTATRQRVWHGRTPVAMDAKHRTERGAAGVAEMFKVFPVSGGVNAR